MTDDPHEPYVAELTQQGDWAGLVIYGLAHGLHRPALDAALSILHGRHFGTAYAAFRTWLTAFMENPIEPREVPDVSLLDLDGPQQLSVHLVATFPMIALCEFAGQFPAEHQTDLFGMGLKTAEQWRELAARTDQAALLAVSCGFIARAALELKHLETAVSSFDEALAAYRKLASARPDVYLPDVAMTLNNLGTVQRNLTRFEDAVLSFDEALAAYRKLASARPDVYLPNVAATLNNLGTVQRNLTRFEDAVLSFDEALAIRRKLASARPDVYLPNVAATLNNLGTVQINLTRFEDAVLSFDEARGLYDTLEQQLGSSQLMERIRCHRNYANLVLRELPERGWPNPGLARELLGKAIGLAERFRGLFGDPRERIRVQQELRGLYAQQVGVCLKCAELYADRSAWDEALEVAEASRSRSLLDALAQQVVPEQAPLELQDQFRRLQRDLRRAQRRLHQEWETLEALARRVAKSKQEPPNPNPIDGDDEAGGEDPVRSTAVTLDQPRYERSAVDLTRSLSADRDQQQRIARVTDYIQQQARPYTTLVEQLRAVDPKFQPDRTVDSFRLSDRAGIFPKDKRTLFVHLQCVDDRLLAMILTPDGLQPVPIPDLNPETLTRLANALVAAQSHGGLSNEALRELMKELIPQVLEDLRPAFTQTLLPAVTAAGLLAGDRLVLVPDDIIGFLPLHGVQINEQECLGDRFEVAYTRSLSVLQQCLRRRRDPATRLFGIIDPTQTLAGPALEATFAGRYFAQSEILKTVDHETLLEKALRAHVFYWMGHSQFSLAVPYWSGLLLKKTGLSETAQPDGTTKTRSVPLAPSDLATFTDIDCGLTMEECSLAIISGCQSGLAISGKGNEPISLVSAFLNAGAKCVVASLWPVDDGACLLTMQRFLHAWQVERLGIAAALKTAQQWLRDLTAQELAAWADTCPELQRTEFRDLKQFLRWKVAQDAIEQHGPDSCPYASPYYWAPFVAVGQSWKADII